jgi:hypothetical protein
VNIISHLNPWSSSGITAAVSAALLLVLIGAVRTWLAIRILSYGNGKKSRA